MPTHALEWSRALVSKVQTMPQIEKSGDDTIIFPDFIDHGTWGEQPAGIVFRKRHDKGLVIIRDSGKVYIPAHLVEIFKQTVATL